MNNKEQFSSNPFSVNLLLKTHKITSSLMEREGFILGENNYHLLSESEKYISNVGKTHMELRDVYNQIHQIRIFLRRFPNKLFYYQNGIGELEYIQYHTESLYYRVHTILEIMKLLVNEVYCLKIPKKECTWNILSGKIKGGAKCLNLIDLYYKVFINIIESRHINSHRGIYIDEEKEEIETKYGLNLYVISQTFNYALDEDFKRLFPIGLIDAKKRKLKKNRIKLIDDCERNIGEILKEFLTSLNDEFIKRAEMFYSLEKY